MVVGLGCHYGGGLDDGGHGAAAVTRDAGHTYTGDVGEVAHAVPQLYTYIPHLTTTTSHNMSSSDQPRFEHGDEAAHDLHDSSERLSPGLRQP